MNAETEGLVLEHLPAIRGDVGAVRDDVRDLHQRLDTHGDRLERIERRLELSGTPA